MMTKQEILEVLGRVYDPDQPDKSIVELGIVEEEGIEVKGDRITITYCMKAPLCPYSAAIGLLIRRAIKDKLGKTCEVRIHESHYQSSNVNSILTDDKKVRDLEAKMESTGLFSQHIR